MTKPIIDWHRLFGVTLIDYFTGSNYQVELEKNLAMQQYLDVTILKKTTGQPLAQVPDGLDNLSDHNLLTYKSHQQPLDSWAIYELIGHYVNYRKQISPSLKHLLPPQDFQLYAVCTRQPQKLAKEMHLHHQQAGVYDITCGQLLTIRVIITSQMPKRKRNTLWHLFSSSLDKLEFATNHHHWHDPKGPAIIKQLYEQYIAEGVFMAYTLEDFYRDTDTDFLETVKRRYSPARIIKLFSPEEVVKALSPEAVVKALSPETVVKALSPEAVVKLLPPEVIEAAYLGKQKKRKRK